VTLALATVVAVILALAAKVVYGKKLAALIPSAVPSTPDTKKAMAPPVAAKPVSCKAQTTSLKPRPSRAHRG